jgi:hypothetical protein
MTIFRFVFWCLLKLLPILIFCPRLRACPHFLSLHFGFLRICRSLCRKSLSSTIDDGAAIAHRHLPPSDLYDENFARLPCPEVTVFMYMCTRGSLNFIQVLCIFIHTMKAACLERLRRSCFAMLHTSSVDSGGLQSHANKRAIRAHQEPSTNCVRSHALVDFDEMNVKLENPPRGNRYAVFAR